MTTPRRPFNYAQFVTRWRWLCDMYGLDAKTSYVLEYEWAYKLDDRGVRRLMRVPVAPEREPECLVDDQAGTWWANPGLWTESGRNHSSTEAAALANVAAQARRAQSLPAMNPESEYALRPSVKAEVAAWAADCVPPLREIHRRQGLVVDEILGVRMIVPIRKPA